MNYSIEVKLLSITPDCENLMERAGRLCYASQDKTGTNHRWLADRIRQGHESLIEHASATFYIKASRALTHELVRHRLGSYSQRSQRYVRETEMDYITPPELNEAATAVFRQAMEAVWDSYTQLLAAGIKPETARYVLPNACATEIVCTWNFREIRHIIKLRSGPAALPEFQEVASALRAIMKEIAPGVFGDL
jgi:thymidylate synthase (FAD)